MAAGMALGLFLAIGLALMAGFPVAFTLAGVALLFAGIGIVTGTFDPVFLEAFPNRVYGIMTNETLIAVPVFVFMGVMLERSKLAGPACPLRGRRATPVRSGRIESGPIRPPSDLRRPFTKRTKRRVAGV